MVREQEGQGYIDLYFTKFCTSLIKMYHTAKVDTIKYFRSELSWLISVMRMKIV